MDEMKKILKLKIIISLISTCLPFFLCLFVIFIGVAFALGVFAPSSNIASKCVHYQSVDEVCKSINVSGHGSMSVDEYVAGVVQHEFGNAPEEVLKAQAIAARSYGIAGATKDGNGNCSIGDTSEDFQTFDSNPSEKVINAANETSGIVLVDSNGNIARSEYSSNSLPAAYDTFGDTITMSERDLKIPRDWFSQNKTCGDDTLNDYNINYGKIEKDAFGRDVYGCGHGRGMGQIAAKYLANEKSYNYEQILEFFYGEDSVYKWTLASSGGASSSCTSNSNNDFGTLEEYNLHHGGLTMLTSGLSKSEIDDLNDYIEDEVNKNDASYKSKVAAAGQALVYWFEKQGKYLGYYWGGGHAMFTGAHEEWGTTNKGTDEKGNKYYGMDCSGFVSWSIRNACKADFTAVAADFLSLSDTSVSSLDKAEPGDVVASKDHVMLVVKNNGDGTVTVAEEGGSDDGLVFSIVDSNRMSWGNRSVIDMGGWYEKKCN